MVAFLMAQCIFPSLSAVKTHYVYAQKRLIYFPQTRIELGILRTTVRCANRYATNTLKLLKASSEAKILHKFSYILLLRKHNIPIFSSGYMIYVERIKVTFRHENIKVSRRWRGSSPPLRLESILEKALRNQ
jgi:hypothetical protein